MKLKEAEPEFYIIKEKEFSLCGKDLAGLIQDTVAKNDSFRFKVKGFSMSPFIKDGDVVTISPPFNSSVGFGEMVAFICPGTGRLVIHRVVGKSGNYYLIKGDDIIKPDGLISEENILGRITEVQRNGKKAFLGLGPARFLIAFLSRWFLLFSILFFLRRFVRPAIKRLKDG